MPMFATMETSQRISSVGHPTNTFDEDDFADNESTRSISDRSVGKGDAMAPEFHLTSEELD